MSVGPDIDSVLEEEVQAAARQAAMQADAVVVVGPVVDLRVLGQVGQDAAVADAGLDLGVERAVVQGLADGLLQAVEPLAAARR